jgi:hypothetical protein
MAPIPRPRKSRTTGGVCFTAEIIQFTVELLCGRRPSFFGRRRTMHCERNWCRWFIVESGTRQFSPNFDDDQQNSLLETMVVECKVGWYIWSIYNNLQLCIDKFFYFSINFPMWSRGIYVLCMLTTVPCLIPTMKSINTHSHRQPTTNNKYFAFPNKRLLDENASLILGSPFSKPSVKKSNRPSEPSSIAFPFASGGSLAGR